MKRWRETLIRPYFVFNERDSREYGIHCLSMPAVMRAQKRTETIEVAGRNGVLHVDKGSYDPVSKVVECAIQDRRRMDEICAWLTGAGDVIFSTEPDKYYKAYISNQIEIGNMMNVFQRFSLEFDCFPLKYSVNYADETIELTTQNPVKIYNLGTVYAEPVIIVRGAGQVTLTLNGVAYAVEIQNGSITIDSEILEVYDDTGSQNSKYTPPDDSKEFFPVFRAGENTLQWAVSGGSVESITIRPNWRWL